MTIRRLAAAALLALAAGLATAPAQAAPVGCTATGAFAFAKTCLPGKSEHRIGPMPVFEIAPGRNTGHGTWKAGLPDGFGKVLEVLKDRNGFTALLWKKLSHDGHWAFSKGRPHGWHDRKHKNPAPIPLPAAAWLLIGGMGVLAATARRRKAATI
jgi:hypothetical protein